MSESIYRALAQRLDTIPSGLPVTQSGVELDLLARLFSPEEAALARAMRLTPEPAKEIAPRAGMDAARARDLLDGMSRKGLIGARRGDDEPAFALEPRLFGIPGIRRALSDPELAHLYEQYYQETRGISLERQPASFRVIPVQEAVPLDMRIHPYEQAAGLLENAKSWGVRDCLCRLWQHAAGRGCDHPLEVCLLFSPVEDAFVDSELDRPIDKEEALNILHEAEARGLVHTTVNFGEGVSNICNCCTCSCVLLRGVTEFGIPTAAAWSDFRVAVDRDRCEGCGDCVDRCQFRALSASDEFPVVDYARCAGCGLCTTACPTGALSLERRPPGENPPIPADLSDWFARFAAGRGMSLEDADRMVSASE
jgi:electron transport complex protein RnfB